MRPSFRAIVEGDDITAKIRDRLLSLRVTDQAGIQSDAIEFRLDNRPREDGQYLKLPPSTREIRLWLGYKDEGLEPLGTYTVDEVGLSGPPDTMTIKAKAAKWMTAFKAPRSRSWHEVTIGTIVRTIAGEHEYRPRISVSLADVAVDHVDQTEESDAHFLTRLAVDHGAIAKPASGYLMFVTRGDAKLSSGKDSPAIAVAREDVVGPWSYLSKDRGKYDAVEAEWQDLAAAQLRVAKAGDGKLVYRLRHSYPDQAAALAAAKAKLTALQRGKATLDGLTLIGNPKIRAESPVELSGFHPDIPTRWIVTSVTHVLDGSGFRTEVDAELPRK